MQCQKLQQVFEVQSFSLDTGPQSFCHRIMLQKMHIPVDNTLFEGSCSGVSSRYCCYGNHTAGSKPIKKTINHSQLRTE